LQPAPFGARLVSLGRIKAKSAVPQEGLLMKQTTPFSLTITRGPGEVVLTLAGEIDTLTGPRFDEAAEVIQGGRGITIVFDMSRVTFMDSTGLSVIAGTLRRLQPVGGRLCIRGASPMIRRLLEISGITQSEMFEIAPVVSDLPTAANR
jgi:anti-anti-sigma factor